MTNKTQQPEEGTMTLRVNVPMEVQIPKDNGERNSHTEHGNISLKECEYEQRPNLEASLETEGKDQVTHEAGTENTESGTTSVKMEVPDGGWGWVVALASCVIMILVPVMGPCFGILFSKYMLQEGTSSTVTSWIFGVQTLLWNVSSLFTRAFSEEFGWRAVGITGCLLACLGFIMTSFTPAPEFLFFSFSVACGIGGGIATSLSFIVVPQYFKKRRGAANAIMTCGAGLGQIIMPPIIIILQETFGDRGATLVFSGIMLHACVAAATFHPVQWHMKPRTVNTTNEDKDTATPPISKAISASTESPQSTIFVRVAKSVVSDLGILRSKRACIICISGPLLITNSLNFLMMMPFAMQDVGLTIEHSAWCLSAMAVASLVIRIICSLLSDLSFFSVRACFICGSAIMAVTSAIFPLLTSIEWVMTIMVMHGIGLGAKMAMYTLVMIDVMGIHRLAPLFGTTSFCNGIGLFTLGPLIGMIRDASQSYAVSIWVLSGLGLCGVSLWALMGQATRHDKQRREEGRLDL